ncbi:cytochrome P450 [Kibdelosporangium lantanae]
MTLTFPQPRTCPYHPSPAYEPLREGPPLAWTELVTGQHAWVVSGYAEARALLADPRVSADRTRPGYPIIAPPGVAGIMTGPVRPFLVMDDPEHNRIRRMLIPDFTVRRFKELRPDIERIVADSLDHLLAAGQPADLVEHFALPVPSIVISRLLGVPYEDHEFFESAARRFVRGTSPDDSQQGLGELVKYLSDLAADPPPGLIARLRDEYLGAGGLQPFELVLNSVLLLVAGHETTSSMLALSVITLLAHPDQLALMRSGRVDETVEELLRYLSVVDAGPQRVAAEDIEIAGVTVKAGDGIVIATALANRDPDVFAEPDRFDVTRSADHHLTFAHGVHQCLGQNLARMELRLALPALFDRIPTLRLAVPVDELTIRPAVSIQGVNTLPVEWGS